MALSNIAPVSWLVIHDTNEGRDRLNFSERGQGKQEVDEAAERAEKGEMPLWFYLLLHPEARLIPEEKVKV